MNLPARQQPSLTIVPTDCSSRRVSWESLPEKKRLQATEQAQIVKTILAMQPKGVKLRPVIDNFLLKVNRGLVTKEITDLALRLGRKNQPPSRSTLYKWVQAYESNGLMGLVKQHKGSDRNIWGWEAAAMRYYSLPSKPAMATVSLWLQQEGHDSATDARVRAYLKSLPTNAAENSRKRLGAKMYRDSQKTFVRRDTNVLDVGFIYQGDGHTVDVYIAHPQTGKSWRPELTAWMDIRSRYLVGWFITESESALTTLFALSHALLKHDHVPAMLHIDNGAGFKSKLVNDKSLGFYARLGIEPMFSIPGNAKGKGQIERWFRTMEDQFGKRWETYCGKDMAPEAINPIVRAAAAGNRDLPSLKQYVDELTQYVEQYNNTPHSALDGKTPAELWSTLERVPVEFPATALCLPQKQVSIRRQAITLDKREYSAAELIQYNGKKLTAEYSIHDDSFIRVLTQDGRWICDANLIQKADYLPSSRIDEAQQNRLKGQEKRLQRKLDETQKRLGNAITHDQVLNDRNSFTGELSEIETRQLENLQSNTIDLITPSLNEPLIEETKINLLDDE